MYYGLSDVHKYLYDSNYNQIKNLEDLTETPSEVIISCRYKIGRKENKLFSKIEPESISKSESYRFIDYGSLITDTEPSTQKKKYKMPLYVLKNKPSSNIKTKSHQLIQQMPFKPLNTIKPSITGKKIKEGPGGFRKPYLYFDKNKKIPNSQRVSIHFDTKKFNTGSISPGILKEIHKIDEICLKYSMTRQEFTDMVSDYTFIKGNNEFIDIESISNAYFINPKIFKGIDKKFSYKKSMNWEDFVKFYSIVVLKRSSFSENLNFLFNYLDIDTVDKLKSIEIAKLPIQNGLFISKFGKIQKKFKQASSPASLASQESCEYLQDEGLTIYDLRILLSLIFSSNN